eukprot:6706282-Prymnesium_polylepis.1
MPGWETNRIRIAKVALPRARTPRWSRPSGPYLGRRRIVLGFFIAAVAASRLGQRSRQTARVKEVKLRSEGRRCARAQLLTVRLWVYPGGTNSTSRSRQGVHLAWPSTARRESHAEPYQPFKHHTVAHKVPHAQIRAHIFQRPASRAANYTSRWLAWRLGWRLATILPTFLL